MNSSSTHTRQHNLTKRRVTHTRLMVLGHIISNRLSLTLRGLTTTNQTSTHLTKVKHIRLHNRNNIRSQLTTTQRLRTTNNTIRHSDNLHTNTQRRLTNKRHQNLNPSKLTTNRRLRLSLIITRPIITRKYHRHRRRQLKSTSRNNISNTNIRPIHRRPNRLINVSPTHRRISLLPLLFRRISRQRPTRVNILRILRLFTRRSHTSLTINVSRHRLQHQLTHRRNLSSQRRKHSTQPTNGTRVLTFNLQISHNRRLTRQKRNLSLITKNRILINPNQGNATLSPLSTRTRGTFIRTYTSKVTTTRLLTIRLTPRNRMLPLNGIRGHPIIITQNRHSSRNITNITTRVSSLR